MDPVQFVFGVHFHQPVGNFDHVFAEHLRDVYRPLVERLTEQRFLPFALHVSGPLLEWLEARSEEHTSELQSPYDLVCRLLLEKKKSNNWWHILRSSRDPLGRGYRLGLNYGAH